MYCPLKACAIDHHICIYHITANLLRPPPFRTSDLHMSRAPHVAGSNYNLPRARSLTYVSHPRARPLTTRQAVGDCSSDRWVHNASNALASISFSINSQISVAAGHLFSMVDVIEVCPKDPLRNAVAIEYDSSVPVVIDLLNHACRP